MVELLQHCLNSLPDVLPRAGVAVVWRTKGANPHPSIPAVGEVGCEWTFKVASTLLVSPKVTPEILASWDEEDQAVLLRGMACYLGIEVNEGQTVEALCRTLRRALEGQGRHGAVTAPQAARSLNLGRSLALPAAFMQSGNLLPSEAFRVPAIVESLVVESEPVRILQHNLIRASEMAEVAAGLKAHVAKALQLTPWTEAMRALVTGAARNAAVQQSLQRVAAQAVRTLGRSVEQMLQESNWDMAWAMRDSMSNAAREALRAVQLPRDFARRASLARPYLEPPRIGLQAEREAPMCLAAWPPGMQEAPFSDVSPRFLDTVPASWYERASGNPAMRAAVLFYLQRRAERALRFLLRRRMAARFGEDWWRTKVPPKMRHKARDQYDAQPGRAADSPQDLLDYLGWYDLGALCLQYWGTVCANVFAWGVTGTLKHFRQMWQESCRRVRNGVDHSRDISFHDFKQCRPFLESIVARVREAYPDFDD